MKDKELRKLIGSRARQRRMELGLNQQYVADKMDVNKSTIQRYESGTIDNTKKLVLEGLAETLHVSVEWLRGESEEYEATVTDKRDLVIRDLMTTVLGEEQGELDEDQMNFAKDLLILMLTEYDLFLDSFRKSCKKLKNSENENKDIARLMGYDSAKEFNELGFLREVMHSVDTYNDIADVIKTYPGIVKKATDRLKTLLSFYGREE